LRELTGANPFPFPIGEDVPPDTGTKPPTIFAVSPQNDSVYNSNNITLNFKVNVLTSSTAIGEKIYSVSYTPSWETDEKVLYENTDRVYIANGELGPEYTEYSCNLSMIGIPEGKHNLTICTIESGCYSRSAMFNTFHIENLSSIFFAIDLTPPEPEPEAFPTLLAAVATGTTTVAVGGAGLLLYFKKRN
jgi:hypothetical protein